MSAKLSPDQLTRAVALQARGFTQEEIAGQIGVTSRTVRSHLRGYNRRVLARLLEAGEAERARQVGVLSWMASEALRGWERSQRDAESVKTTSASGGAGDAAGPVERTERTMKGQVGTPAFLAEARAALADVRKVLGLDKTEGDDPATGAALAVLAAALETAVGRLPADVQGLAREQVSRAILEVATHDRDDRH